jgi:hypothetical protein
VDVIPNDESGLIDQNSEISIGVNPLNPNQLVTGIFGFSNPNGPSPFFVSNDGGKTWTYLQSIDHVDKSINWSNSGTAYIAPITDGGLTDSVFSSTDPAGGTLFTQNSGSILTGFVRDQPWVRATSVNGQDHIYMAYNDLTTASSNTATVEFSTDGGATWTVTPLERGNPGAGQDAPSVRLAVSGNTVYGGFLRWTKFNGNDTFATQVVVVKDTQGGAGGFKALGNLGTTVATTTTPFSPGASGGGSPPTLGSERVGSDLAMAVDPNNANHLYVAYDSVNATTGLQLEVHVAESTDGGKTFTEVYKTSIASGFQAAEPAIAVDNVGEVGLEYNAASVDASGNPTLETHFVNTSNDFATSTDTTIMHMLDDSDAPFLFNPYLGDFNDLTAVGNTFYGGFTGNNHANGIEALYPQGVTFQRNFSGKVNTSSFTLLDNTNSPITPSIDPFVFTFNSNLVAVTPTLTTQTEGQTFTSTVATFTDTSGNFPAGDYSANINWGDNSTSVGQVVVSGKGFSVLGTHTYAEEGNYTYQVTVTNTFNTIFGMATGSVTVKDASLALNSFTLPPGYPVGSQAPFTIGNFKDTDPGGTVTDYTATIDWGDSSTTTLTSANGGIITNPDGSFSVFTPGHAYAATGSFTVSLKVVDVGGATVSQAGTLNVTPVELTLQSATPPPAVEGLPNSTTLATFTDSNNPPLADFTATIQWGDGSSSTLSAASGGIVSNGNGTFSVVGGHIYAEEQRGAQFILSVSDSVGGFNATALTFDVADAPLKLTSVGNAGGFQEGVGTSATVATFTDANPNPTIGDFTATVDWGDGNVDTFTSASGGIVANGAAFSVVGGHAYAEEGSNTITVSIHDVGGANISATGSASIADAKLVGSGLNFNGSEGAGLGSTVLAQFSDLDTTNTQADPVSDTSDYTASVSWTDATGTHNAAGQLVYTGQGRTFNVMGTNQIQLEEGTFNISVTVQDVGGAILSATSVATISDASLQGTAKSVTAVEGQSLGGAIAAQFTDTDPTNTGADPLSGIGDYTATVSYTDANGTHSAPGVISWTGNGRTFNVQASSLTFSEEGTYNLTVVAQDTGGATATIASTVTVSDAPLALIGSPNSYTVNEGSTLNNVQVGAFSDTDPTATPSDPQGDTNEYTATITWDDGLGVTHTSPGTIVSTGGNTFAVMGSNTTPFLEGNRGFSVAITDKGGATVTAPGSVTVVPGPESASGTTFEAVEGVSGSWTIGSYQNASQPARAANGNTVVINWGDGTSSSGTVQLVSPGNWSITGSHAYNGVASYNVSFTVTDAGGNVATSSTSTATVVDAPLTLVAVTPPGTILAGQTLSNWSVMTFADANQFASAGQFSATISWGDGTTTGGAIRSNGNGTFSVLGTHTYGSVSNVPLVVTVLDAGGSSVSGSARVSSSTPMFLGDSLTSTSNSSFLFFLELEFLLALFGL